MSQHKGEGGLSLGWLLPAPNRSGRPVAPTAVATPTATLLFPPFVSHHIFQVRESLSSWVLGFL
jgi:hypothetical protein